MIKRSVLENLRRYIQLLIEKNGLCIQPVAIDTVSEEILLNFDSIR